MSKKIPTPKKVYPLVEPEEVHNYKLIPWMVGFFDSKGEFGKCSHISPIYEKLYSHKIEDSTGQTLLYGGSVLETGEPLYIENNPEIATEFEVLSAVMKKIGALLGRKARPRYGAYGDTLKKKRKKRE